MSVGNSVVSLRIKDRLNERLLVLFFRGKEGVGTVIKNYEAAGSKTRISRVPSDDRQLN